MNLIDFVNKGDLSLLPDGLETKYVFKGWFKDTFTYVSDETDTTIHIEHPYYYAELNHVMSLEELARAKANNQVIDLSNTRITNTALIQAMLDDWDYVPCKVSDSNIPFSDMTDADLISSIHYSNNTVEFRSLGCSWVYAIPFDPKTGKQIIDYDGGEIILVSDEL